jgi:FkbM family methyltransferase
MKDDHRNRSIPRRVLRRSLVASARQVLRRLPFEYLYELRHLASEVAGGGQQSDAKVTLTIGAVDFDLWLSAGLAPESCKTYTDMQATGAVHEAALVRCLQCVLARESAPVFVDIGSYVGYYACYVSGYVADRRSVYAVESNDAHCDCIRRAVQENGYHNLKVLNSILSDRAESLTVYKESVADGTHLASLVDLERHEQSRREIILRDGVRRQAETFDDLCTRETIRPTIVKIDVRGSEGKVLGGSTHTLKNSVRYVFLEMHPEEMLMQYSPGYTRQSILELLTASGFRCYLIAGFRGTKRSPEAKRLRNTGELTYLPIDMRQFDTIFFDRNLTDLFVLAAKQDINIMSLDCFAGGTA